jgi:hypothetical protein
MSDKPVEVWCVVDGERILAYDINAESFRNNDEMTNYRCERRLLVKEGETFADGVDACIRSIASQELAWRTYEHNDKSHIAQFLMNRLHALSHAPEPTKDEATELLRQDLKRAIDAYLKGKA